MYFTHVGGGLISTESEFGLIGEKGRALIQIRSPRYLTMHIRLGQAEQSSNIAGVSQIIYKLLEYKLFSPPNHFPLYVWHAYIP